VCDLYLSRRDGDGRTPAKNLGPKFNSEFTE